MGAGGKEGGREGDRQTDRQRTLKPTNYKYKCTQQHEIQIHTFLYSHKHMKFYIYIYINTHNHKTTAKHTHTKHRAITKDEVKNAVSEKTCESKGKWLRLSDACWKTHVLKWSSRIIILVIIMYCNRLYWGNWGTCKTHRAINCQSSQKIIKTQTSELKTWHPEIFFPVPPGNKIFSEERWG